MKHEPNYEWEDSLGNWTPVKVDLKTGVVTDCEKGFQYTARWSQIEKERNTRPYDTFTPKGIVEGYDLGLSGEVHAAYDALTDKYAWVEPKGDDKWDAVMTEDAWSTLINHPEVRGAYEWTWDGDSLGVADDPVNDPKHYGQGTIEAIEYIEDFLTQEEYIGFLRGNVAKYMHRFRYKGKSLEDLKKARWYLNRLIDVFEYGFEQEYTPKF